MAHPRSDAYPSWDRSWLAEKVSSASRRDRLDGIWSKLQPALSRATWEGWVDHGQAHVLAVLHYLDQLIPSSVYETLREIEAFVLIAGALLHDLGMIRPESASTSPEVYAELRKQHGPRGAVIAGEQFADHLRGLFRERHAVCEIIRSHHGPFSPETGVGELADLRALALWVRLADELHFGPDRAPIWLLEHIRPDPEELKHWRAHNEIEDPAIDLDLFRIRVGGRVESDALTRKLRTEFEAPDRQAIQIGFLKRGQERQERNCFFIIWDETRKAPEAIGGRIDTRPVLFSDEQYFLAGRYAYNLGRFDVARRCFEDGVRRVGTWADLAAGPYFYQYIKTLISLGEFEQALQAADLYADADLPTDIRAAVTVARGLAHLKLGQLKEARNLTGTAAVLYQGAAQQDADNRLYEADAWVLHAATYLEQMRATGDLTSGALRQGVERSLRSADELFSAHERDEGGPESHYRGRYWGLRAFYALAQIEASGRCDGRAWDEALAMAERAFGGEEHSNRTPFGVLCGKFCAAAVSYHKYLYCSSTAERQQALEASAQLIADVRRAYDQLLGPTERVRGVWPKVHGLFVSVRDSAGLPDEWKGRLRRFYGSDEPAEAVEILTPIR